MVAWALCSLAYSKESHVFGMAGLEERKGKGSFTFGTCNAWLLVEACPAVELISQLNGNDLDCSEDVSISYLLATWMC